MLECKSCGAQISVEEGQQVVTCPYCGSQNTVSRNMESVGNLFNRANYLRRQNEFDRAIEVYEQILQNSTFEYEAYWGLLLCQYGIEYVEDPATHKRIPTCHRTQTESILQQPNFKKTIQYAPYDVSQVYKAEAAEIDRLQKSILSLAQKQEKYDVFICYKESDEDGERTEDSVIAQELYERLIQRGYKVFFSRKTLEKKLGSAYEPIIYAALNSVQVMIVLGLKPEHFSAVWVRNEWSRYLERMKKNPNLALIPAYRGFSPYELPNEFANLQALDMSKLGFMQELCDGIDRIVGHSMSASMTTPSVQVNDQNLVKRGFALLKDGNFKDAEGCFDRCLDQNMENAEAYLGKLLAENHFAELEDLKKLQTSLTKMSNYNNAFRFASPELQEQLEEIAEIVQENARKKKKKRRRKIRILVAALSVLVIAGGAGLVLTIPDQIKVGEIQACLESYGTDEWDSNLEEVLAIESEGDIPARGIPAYVEIIGNLLEMGNKTQASDMLVSLNQQQNLPDNIAELELSCLEEVVENGVYDGVSSLLTTVDNLSTHPQNYSERVQAILTTLSDNGRGDDVETFIENCSDEAVSSNDKADILNSMIYSEGIQQFQEGKYSDASYNFRKILDYQDASSYFVKSNLAIVETLLDEMIDSEGETNRFGLVRTYIQDAKETDNQELTTWLNSNAEKIYESILIMVQYNSEEYEFYNSYTIYIELLDDISQYYTDAKMLKEIIKALHQINVTGSTDIDELKAYIDRDLVKTIIMQSQSIAQTFLEGNWTSGSWYFTMDEDGSTNYNLPWFTYGDYYSIEDGVYFLYVDGSYETDRRNMFRFTILSWDSISVYCYEDGSTYTLYRN